MKTHVILFQRRFASAIVSGEKQNTIRLPRKRPIRAGDVVSLRTWTGLPYRSKQRTLGTARVEGVEPIRIDAYGILVAGEKVNAETLAKGDGFSSFGEMLDWFEETHALPFTGELIVWGSEFALELGKIPSELAGRVVGNG